MRSFIFSHCRDRRLLALFPYFENKKNVTKIKKKLEKTFFTSMGYATAQIPNLSYTLSQCEQEYTKLNTHNCNLHK